MNVVNLVEQILKYLNYDNDFICKAKIACILHDVGVLQGKDNHPQRSYEFAKKYFNNKNIKFKDMNLVLEAIKNHSSGFDTDNIITLSLILADKLDIKKTRVTKEGKNIEGMRQLLYIDDIKININGNILIINFCVNDKINLDELNNFYFTKKVFKAVEAFFRKLNLEYKILINNKIWSIN